MHSVLASTSTATTRTSVTQFILSDAGKREFVLMRVNKTDCSLGETILLGKDKTPLYEVDGFDQAVYLVSGAKVVVSEEYVVQSLLSDVLSRSMSSSGLGHKTSDNTQSIDLRTNLHPKGPLPKELAAVRPYPQVFADRHGFIPRASIIDLVCNCGPDARGIIR